MVKLFWDEEIANGIIRTKRRIKHYESHRIGDAVIKEKSILKKQERLRDLRLSK